jgi:hypothetical protein
MRHIMSLPAGRSSASVRLLTTACLALAMLLLGGAAHLQHHLEDAGCDRGPAPESHACASCSGLHGGALAAVAPTVLASQVFCAGAPPLKVTAPGIEGFVADAPPRAPPPG